MQQIKTNSVHAEKLFENQTKAEEFTEFFSGSSKSRHQNDGRKIKTGV